MCNQSTNEAYLDFPDLESEKDTNDLYDDLVAKEHNQPKSLVPWLTQDHLILNSYSIFLHERHNKDLYFYMVNTELFSSPMLYTVVNTKNLLIGIPNFTIKSRINLLYHKSWNIRFKIFSDSIGNAKIKCIKIMCIINTNVAWGCLSENYLTQTFIARNISWHKIFVIYGNIINTVASQPLNLQLGLTSVKHNLKTTYCFTKAHAMVPLTFIIIYIHSAAKLYVWYNLWREPCGGEWCDDRQDDDIHNDKEAHNQQQVPVFDGLYPWRRTKKYQ